jgi:GNAT superfamily N-acetyltransferase
VADVVAWTSERLDDLVALVEASLLDEAVSPDELLAAAWDRPGFVAGDADGDGAVVARVADASPQPVVDLVLLAVHPGARRLGSGGRLLAEAELWARAQGAAELRIGGPVGSGPWPGIDVRTMPGMLCLAEANGFEPTGAAVNLSVPATFRSDPPDGIVIRRVLDAGDETAVRRVLERGAEFGPWRDAVARSIEHGACLAAFDGVDALGFASHSIDRAGWLGPMGTVAEHRGRGLGAALLGAVARDLMVAGLRDVQVVGADRVRLFVRAGGAVSRVFRTYRKSLT